MEVTLAQMLEARENRALRQRQLNWEYGKTIVSFSMNIAGPVKDSPLIRRGFRDGCRELESRLPENAVVHREAVETVTGCEAMYVLDMEPLAVKSVTARIEDTHGLGRLFDMDVLGPELTKIDRGEVGGGSRNCIVCDAPGRGCTARRMHTVEQLQTATSRIFRDHYARSDRELIGDLAVRSLLEEVGITPKPGLVDRRNSGSHRDMDIRTFQASAAALSPYFHACVEIGMDTAGSAPDETFSLLRAAGLRAEQAMYGATGGVNTHKGAIFTLGVLCGAAGRLWTPEGAYDPAALCREVSSMTRKAMEEDWKRGGETIGHRLYREYGIRGIRGEAADGLPSVTQIGLPVFRGCLKKGMDLNEAGVRTLLHLIARVQDTNLIARGGISAAKRASERAAALLKTEFTTKDVEALDDWFIAQNLSAGGCADLLAAVIFLHSLT